jgi:hypothetical protein
VAGSGGSSMSLDYFRVARRPPRIAKPHRALIRALGFIRLEWLFVPQRDNGVHARGSTRRDVAG